MKDEDANEICKPDYTYVLYNRIKHKLFLAKDTDGYDLDPIRLWYSSDYISLPIYKDDCMTVEAITEMCKRAEKLLKSDMKIRTSEDSCHIALTKSISNNTSGRIYDYGQDRLFHELEISTEHFEKMYKVVKVEAILCGCLARMKEKSEKIELRL